VERDPSTKPADRRLYADFPPRRWRWRREHAWHKAASGEPEYVAGKELRRRTAGVDTRALMADWNGFRQVMSAPWRISPGREISTGFRYRRAHLSRRAPESNAPVDGAAVCENQVRTAGRHGDDSGPKRPGGRVPLTARTLHPTGRRVQSPPHQWSRSIDLNAFANTRPYIQWT